MTTRERRKREGKCLWCEEFTTGSRCATHRERDSKAASKRYHVKNPRAAKRVPKSSWDGIDWNQSLGQIAKDMGVSYAAAQIQRAKRFTVTTVLTPR